MRTLNCLTSMNRRDWIRTASLSAAALGLLLEACDTLHLRYTGSFGIPPEPMPLLLVHFLQDAEGTRPAIVSADREQHIQKTHRRGIGVAQVRFHRREKTFVRIARDRRDKCVRDADTIRAIGPGLLHAFH